LLRLNIHEGSGIISDVNIFNVSGIPQNHRLKDSQVVSFFFNYFRKVSEFITFGDL